MSSARQDGQTLWVGMLDAPSELLASLLALLEETTFFNVMGKKGKSLAKRDGDEFVKALEKRTCELKDLKQHELILRLLAKLEEIADVAPGYLAAPRDFEDLCGELAAQAVELKREGEKKFQGDSLTDLVAHVMQEILAKIEEQFESLKDADQQKLIDELRNFLSSLPEKQQQAFRKALNVDSLTNEVVRQAILKGSLGIGFSAIVGIGGFAFYTAATSMLAGLAGLVGFTLPFAAYTTLSSLVAVAVNPVTIILVVLGTFATGWWTGSQKIKKTLYPLVVVQLAATGSIGSRAEGIVDKESAVIGSWRLAVRGALHCRSKLQPLVEKQKECRDQLETTRSKAKELKRQTKKIVLAIDKWYLKIEDLVIANASNIRDGNWGEAFKEYGFRIVEEQTRIDESRMDLKKERILDRAKGKAERLRKRRRASSRQMSARDELIEAIKECFPRINANDTEAKKIFNSIGVLMKDKEVNETKHAEFLQEIEKCEKELERSDTLVTEAKEKLEKAEGRYFGLKEAATDWPQIAKKRLPAISVDKEFAVALGSPLFPQSQEQRLLRLLRGSRGDGAFAGLTIGDFLYDYLRIDPLVIEGIDFARAADLSNPLLFAEFASKQAGLMAIGEGDSISRLHGYVAERMVAQHMSAAGHDVSFPAYSNQEGWDLLIDGQPFQVKCTESASYIMEHLEKYPDIPVIVNNEHAEEFSDVPGVYVEPGLSVTEVRSMTETGIEDGAELADFELPWIALAVSTAVELRALCTNRLGFSHAGINILTDTAGRVTGGTIGASAGSILGSFLFGPAGSVIGGLSGVIGGGVGGRRVANIAKVVLVRQESESARVAARTLAEFAAKLVPEKLNVWYGKRQTIEELAKGSGVGQIREWLLHQMDEDVHYFEQKQRELEKIASESEKVDASALAHQVLNLINSAGIHPHRLQESLRDLFGAIQDLNTASARYHLRGTGG